MKNRYPIKIEKESTGYSTGVDLGISSKLSIEIANLIRGMDVKKAKKRLEEIISMRIALPLTRFNNDVGHKPKMGPGRYPLKASTQIFKLIESAESNARDKGLNINDLYIFHISANRSAQQWKYGRQRRRKAKKTKVQVVLKEKESKKEDKKTQKTVIPTTINDIKNKQEEKKILKIDIPKEKGKIDNTHKILKPNNDSKLKENNKK